MHLLDVVDGQCCIVLGERVAPPDTDGIDEQLDALRVIFFILQVQSII